MAVVVGARRLSLYVQGQPANVIDRVSFLKTYSEVSKVFARRTEDRVDGLVALLDTPFYPVHNPQGDPLVSDTNAPSLIPRLGYRAGIRFIVMMGRGAVDRLISKLSHPNPNVRIGVIMALGKIGDASAVEPLMTIARTSEPLERTIAVAALGRINYQGVVEDMIALLKDPSVEVRGAAVCALGERGDTTALPELEWAARADRALAGTSGPSMGELAEEAIEKIRKRFPKS